MLLLRVVLFSFLVQDAVAPEMQGAAVLRELAACAGLSLTLGFWTPLTAIAVSILEICIATTLGKVWPFALASSVAIALAFIGPGAHSLDARKFGRKRLIFEEPGRHQAGSFESDEHLQ